MKTVLVVDDEPSMRRVLRGFLERAGLTVVEARSGVEALALAHGEQQFDALVCDVLMPELSGLDFYDQLLDVAPAMRHRVVFLTGAAHDPAINSPIEQRGVPLVSKLDDLTLVVDAVRLVLYAPRG